MVFISTSFIIVINLYLLFFYFFILVNVFTFKFILFCDAMLCVLLSQQSSFTLLPTLFHTQTSIWNKSLVCTYPFLPGKYAIVTAVLHKLFIKNDNNASTAVEHLKIDTVTCTYVYVVKVTCFNYINSYTSSKRSLQNSSTRLPNSPCTFRKLKQIFRGKKTRSSGWTHIFHLYWSDA